MIIDVLAVVLLVLGVLKGYNKGLIVAVFSLVGCLVGLAAAVKLSAVVAAYLGKHTGDAQKWLPILSFGLVFVAAVLLVRLGAAMVEKAVKVALMGWANKLGGILLFVLLYATMLSVVLFYAQQIRLLSAQAIADSRLWPFLQPLGPAAISTIGALIPLFENLFETLESFFGQMTENNAPKA
jgi:membrane protein required for colicin V production